MEGSAMKQTRGIRNNNPLNLTKSDRKWAGEVEGSDTRFCTFATMNSGIHAALLNLYAYMTKHRLHTIEKIVKRWAPPVENDTYAYINHVCKSTGIAPNDPFGFDEVLKITEVIRAMAYFESGLTGKNRAILSEYVLVCKKKNVQFEQADYEKAYQRAQMNDLKHSKQ